MADQRRRLKAYAAAHGLQLIGVYSDDGVSARSLRRTGLEAVLEHLSAGKADGLVVAKLDRLSRTTRDVLDLVARAEWERWALHSIDERLDTDSPHGRFVVTVLAALAQMERERGSERTRNALAELRRRGKRVSGKPPFGYRFDQERVVEAPEEQPILVRIMRLHDDGMGAWKIARELADAGVTNPRTGQRWTPGTVGDIVRTALAKREDL